ncbi:MAG: DUF2283 domain-containing protein [Chloroflexi bacterium]|nr:DUF2283 domain-containing protein [Chloroflexota bacterium]
MAEKLVLDKVRFNYDSEGDVLYISFGEPEAADDSDVTEEGIIVRLRQDKIVGLTILNAREKLYLR